MLSLALTTLIALSSPADAPAWQSFSEQAFEDAQKQNKLVVVHVGTKWCHWCHVMDETTWADPEIRAMLKEHFIAIRADADEEPDVGERFEEWGWPAIIFMKGDGTRLANVDGYRNPKKMKGLLALLISQKKKGILQPLKNKKIAGEKQSDLELLHKEVSARLDSFYDTKLGAWSKPKKYPLYAPIEYSFVRAMRRDESDWAWRSRFTLDVQRNIADEVWGGLYQYSTQGDWEHPHTEKLTRSQGAALSMYADGYRAFKKERDLVTAKDVRRYLERFMRDKSGAFYANQDADVGTRGGQKMKGPEYYALDESARLAVGVPFIDRQIFAEHNGAVIVGLAKLCVFDQASCELARGAYDAISKSHRVSVGHFSHKAGQKSMFLRDQVGMLEAALELFDVFGDERFRNDALLIHKASDALFEQTRALYRAKKKRGTFEARYPFRENARMARSLIRLSSLTDDKTLHERAEKMLVALSPDYKNEGRYIGEYLLAIDELIKEPVHVALIDDKDNELRRAAQQVLVPGRVLDARPGGKRFPSFNKPVAFVCGERVCSKPLFNEEELTKTMSDFLKR